MSIVQHIIAFPHFLIFLALQKRKELKQELAIWSRVLRVDQGSTTKNFFWFFINRKEYRSLLYFRIGKRISKYISWIAPGIPNLYFTTPPKNIGTGLVMQHGYSTIINAKEIGINCQIWHNVTIGKEKPGGGLPTIKENVKIMTGAVVVGPITIGKDVVIGANSVVTKDVPDGATVVGAPARIIKIYGKRI